MPKSGSHLINQVVQGLPGLGPFVNPGFPPVNRDEVNDKLPDAAVLANLSRMRPGDIGYGYIKARQPFLSLLTQPGWATIFVYRDPRDMLVSHVFYATQMHPGHGMHRYYTETLHTMEERLNAAIQGVDEPGAELSPIRQKYDGYLGWLDQPEVLCLRFEDLIFGSPGGAWAHPGLPGPAWLRASPAAPAGARHPGAGHHTQEIRHVSQSSARQLGGVLHSGE